MGGSENLALDDEGEAERRKARLGSKKSALRTLRRGVLKPWSVLPGTWQTSEKVLEHGDFAPLACPRPASSHWQTPFKGRTETRGLPSPCLRGTSPGAASTFGVALPASSRSVPLQD